MSWDIFAQRLPADARSVSDIPNDFQPDPIGARSDVLTVLFRRFPDGKLDEFGFLTAEAGGIGFEIHVPKPEGSDDQISGLTFVVRGANQSTINEIADIIDHFGMRAIETGSGGFFDRATALEGYAKWRRYRDHAIGDGTANHASDPTESA